MSKTLLFFLFFFNQLLFGQFENFDYKTNPPEVFENQNFSLIIELLEFENVNQAVLFFRGFGEGDFISKEMIIQGNSLIVEIDGRDVKPPFIDCYVKGLTENGVEFTYPQKAFETKNFIRIDIKNKTEQSGELILLNPVQDDILTKEEFFIAFSILRVKESLDLTKIRIMLNELDISRLIQISDDLVYIPQGSQFELKTGVNSLKIFLYDKSGNLLKELSVLFQIISEIQKKEFEKIKFVLNGSAELNLSNENLRFGSNNFNRLNLLVNSNYGSIFSNANVFITNEEKSFLQPQNRFSFLLYNNWFKLNIGDHFPSFPSLILSGKRVRGFGTDIKLGFINFQATYGEITRKIEGNLLTLIKRDTIVLDPNLIKIDSIKYGQPFGLVRFGNFSRKIFAVRPYFGSGENFQLGFTYLHSRDDENSIEFGSKPRENLVIGSDLFLGFDNKRIQFNFQGAFSFLNNDISLGNISDSTLDSLKNNNNLGIDADLLRKIRDLLGNFITVNQHISPLNPHKLPTLALETGLSLNYLGNYFKGNYTYIGNDYSSFGQNFIRTDIKGFQILDRISLFENRVFLSLTYERLNDNLQKTKITTTTFNNYETALSLYLRNNFPIINFSFSNFDTKNDIDQFTNDSLSLMNMINDNIKVFNFSSSYDLKYFIKHKLSFNFINSSKTDRTPKDFSSKFNSFNFSIQNIWKKDLNTFIKTTFSNSKIKNTDFDYFSITLGGRLSLFENKLTNSASLSVFSGDLKRSVLDLSARYSFMKNLYSNFNLRYIFNSSNIKNESIINFSLRYELY